MTEQERFVETGEGAVLNPFPRHILEEVRRHNNGDLTIVAPKGTMRVKKGTALWTAINGWLLDADIDAKRVS